MDTMPVTMMMNGAQTSMIGSGGHVNRRNGHEQGDWRKNRIEELRQEQFKEALNLLDAFAGGLDHIRGLDARPVGRAEGHHFAVQLGTQSELDPFGGFGAEACGVCGGQCSEPAMQTIAKQPRKP